MTEMPVRFISDPNAAALAVAGLPPGNTKRWVIRRKAEVVAAVRGGFLSLDVACERYKLTIDEFLIWYRLIARHGQEGLRVTKVMDYRGQR
jgi:hypothetical protein